MIKVLIIGTGSIAKKHYKAMVNFTSINKIRFFSKRKSYNYNKVSSKKEILDFNPDYIIICSETYKHYGDLKKLTIYSPTRKFWLRNHYFIRKRK